MTSVPEGVPYTGPSGIMRDSIWLTNEDIPHDRDTVVTISEVIRRDDVTFQQGRKIPVVLSLRFAGTKSGRELKVNATMKKVLNTMCGSTNCGAWVGKRIALFVEQNVRRPDGTYGPAVRIRAKRIEQAEPAPTVNEPVQGGDS